MASGRVELLRTVAAKVLDLRAEFEAQLRAVTRVEELVEKTRPETGVNEERWRRLDEALHRGLSEMLTNNANIRIVLAELVGDVGGAAEEPSMSRRR